MTWLAEIAARSASRTRTVSHWDGQRLTTVIETIEPAIQADAPEQTDEAAEQAPSFRAEIHAMPHLMSVKGGHVHYGDPSTTDQNLPACRWSYGNHRVTYYRTVELPVTCTNCTSRYGAKG